MSKDAWNPTQYDKYKQERSQPFLDLLAMLLPRDTPKIIDLGCGTGELTQLLHKKFPGAQTSGLDLSSEMLAKTAQYVEPGLTFEQGSIEGWQPKSQFDIVFSNAAIQWCDNHRSIFSNIKSSLRPNGQIAIQMPMNFDYPTHIIAHQMANEDPWKKFLNHEAKPQSVLSIERYSELLFDLGFDEQKVLLKVYGHVLDSRNDVVEWVKGTLLKFFKSHLSEDQYQEFLIAYRNRLFEQLPERKPFFYPFKRTLIWARL